jgi:hypothetical protein
MRLDKLTTKSQEALQQAQALADKRNHQAIDVEHLLFALAWPKRRRRFSLLQKLGVPLGSLTERLQKAFDRLPQITGGAGQTYITPRLKKDHRKRRIGSRSAKRRICFHRAPAAGHGEDAAKRASFSKSSAPAATRFSMPWSAFAARSELPIPIPKKIPGSGKIRPRSHRSRAQRKARSGDRPRR